MRRKGLDPNMLIKSQLEELQCMENCDYDAIKQGLIENQNKIKSNNELYFDKKQNDLWVEHYYCKISMDKSKPDQLFHGLRQLITLTHKHKYPYYISKDQYLYTWVDLQPNGQLKGIYSGELKSPLKMIEEDYEAIQKRFEGYQQLNFNNRFLSIEKGQQEQQVIDISRRYRFNTEHVVPQSWFNAKEPMKGDLHHLFVCEPKCNNVRSNFHYFDFKYVQKTGAKNYRDDCGTYEIGRFEPEYGKGEVARATLYFLLRYPGKIKRKFRKGGDINLLPQWHEQFPVTDYERHRNNAIFEIQGNRNPFIDFPDLIGKISLNDF